MTMKTISYRVKADGGRKRLLSFLCHITKNIYNTALFQLRQAFFQKQSIPSWFDLNKILKTNENFHLINVYASSCSIRDASTVFSVFLSNMRKGFRMPKYLSKNSYHPFVTEQFQLREINGRTYVKIPFSNEMRTGRMFRKEYEDPLINKFIEELNLREVEPLYLPVPKKIKDSIIRELRIVPLMSGDDFKIEFVYEHEQEKKALDTNRMMSIDIGMKNLLACVTTDNKSYLIKGGFLSSKLEWFNHRISDAMSKLPQGIHTSRKLRKLFYHSRCFVDDFVNKAVSYVRDKCIEENIGTLIVGWNDGLKEGGIKNESLKNRTRKKINRKYCRIPLSKMKDKLVERCTDIGMEVHVVNESYTSVSSFYDNDPLTENSQRSGTRLHRGMYITRDGSKVNADINGALNIMRAHSPEAAMPLMGKGITSPTGIRIAL